ncbi:MAG: cytochrome c [Ferruginibacter sp.]
MKSFILSFFTVCIIYSCAKKMTPTATAVPGQTVKPPADMPKEAVKKMEGPAEVAGKQIYTTKCARCHGLKNVEEWTVQEWIPILDRMAPKAGLDASEKANVAAYVNFHAKSN